ncbi:MAG: hypothetical protein IKP71_03485 [Candidatus Riflebacteria bacterium]|nr:hypothetical protein [Candidatus Riflebacteria bacterium]
MGFLFDSEEDKVKERVAFVKNLSKQLNANYYYGLKDVKDDFNLGISNEKPCNVIVGNIEGFDYCLVEYYHKMSGRHDHSHWVSLGSIRMHDDYPDFELSTIRSVKVGSGCSIFFGILFVIPTLATLALTFKSILNIFDEGIGEGLFGAFMFGFCTLGLAFVSYVLFSSGRYDLKQADNQGKYNIRNIKFRQKYAILSEGNSEAISRIFTDKVCERVVEANPEIYSIKITRSCITEDIGNEQMTLSSCQECLKSLLQQAQIFENDDDVGDSIYID